MRIFDDTPYQSIDHGPVLVELTLLFELQQQWLNQCHALPLGCFLTTPTTVDIPYFIRLLRHRLTVEKNKHPTFLRYYEPRGLLAFLGALTLKERQDFLPQVQAVYWYHHQWFKAAWPAKEAEIGPIHTWNLYSHQLDNMQTIMNAQLSSSCEI